MNLPFAENYKIKMVEQIRRSERNERERWIKEAKYNLFMLKSDYVFIDLLTDSGTGAMSDKQWAEMMTGDESYAGARSFYGLKNIVKDLFGMEYCLPTHQGRAAENVLFSALLKEGDIIPGNAHFDTTKGHIEFRKATPIDVTTDEAKNTDSDFPFKGNHDLEKLEKVMAEHHNRVPFILVTITNNNAGGQPVSMECIKAVRKIADKYKKMLVFDSARFAENAYFIKTCEKDYEKKSIKDIVREMYKNCDVLTMSAKKDAIVNIGGIVATKHEAIYDAVTVFSIMNEGFLTYGGLAGRDMAAMAQGLDENTDFDMLETRIKQVEYLGKKLDEYGIPYQHPAGGHAIFVDANKVLPNLPKEEFRAQTLAIELYLEAGVRGVEIGALLTDRDPLTRENRFPNLEFLRLAIPRRTYTNNHLDVVAVALKNVFDRRETITKGLKIVNEKPIMRHFTIEMDKI
jgi:tryptophanase